MSPSRISRKHLTSDERAALLLEYTELILGGVSGKVKDLAARYGVHPDYPACLKRAVDEKRASETPVAFGRSPGSGRPTVWTDEKLALLRDFAEAELYEFTMRAAGDALNVSAASVHRILKKQGWRNSNKTIKPSLNSVQKQARMQWATEERRNGWEAWVDIDEKWFFAIDMNTTMKLPPNVQAPHHTLQSKSHIPKVMALVAVARPCAEHNFDGIVGAWRVGTFKKAQRKSKNRAKGDSYFVDCSMDSEVFLDIMKTKVIPAVRRKLHWCEEIVIQLDNAPAHGSAATRVSLNKSLSRTNSEYNQVVSLKYQPAQSPDCNVLDLAIFASLGKRVWAEHKHKHSLDLNILWSTVEKIVNQFPSDVLSRGYDLKSKVLRQIIDREGGNDYVLEHSK